MNTDVAFTPRIPKGIAPVETTVAPPHPIHPATTESPVARVILIGLAAQRHIVKGLTVGAVKGGGRR